MIEVVESLYSSFSSDNENITPTYQEESDSDNKTLQDIIEKEKRNQSVNELNISEIDIGDYDLVKFC